MNIPQFDENNNESGVGRAFKATRSGTRLDVFLAGALAGDGVSREKCKALIRSGQVRVSGRVVTSPREPLKAGEPVEVSLLAERSAIAPEEGEVDVVCRDAFLAVLNKPHGLTVHPCPSCPENTLAHRLVGRFPELAGMDGFRPGIVHRLDKDTSGLMLVALAETSRLALAQLFADRHIHKEYLAIVHGTVNPADGSCEAPIGRHPQHKTKMAVVKNGRPAKSSWKTLYADPGGLFSLLSVRIYTGRTHQIRVHMAFLGHPLVGDEVYGRKGGNDFLLPGGDSGPVRFHPRRQMLHAWKLSFEHPFAEAVESESPVAAKGSSCIERRKGRVMEFTCPPPCDFTETILNLSRRPSRVVITGSPGCGKSSLLKALEGRGIPVFSADAAVAGLYKKGGDGWIVLKARFGDKFIPDEDGPVDKGALASAMARSDQLRREIEGIVHPMVSHALESFWEKTRDAGFETAVAEIPLFLEAGFNRVPVAGAQGKGKRQNGTGQNDIILVGVHCRFDERKKRLSANRGWSDEMIARVESWQWPEGEKMAACDHVVDNSGPESALAGEAARLLETLEAARMESLAAISRRLQTIFTDDSFP